MAHGISILLHHGHRHTHSLSHTHTRDLSQDKLSQEKHYLTTTTTTTRMIRSVCCSSPLLLLLLLLSVATLQVAHAFPFNAGGCPRAVPAVQNSVHTQRNPQSNGFLEAGSLTVEIDGIALATGGNPIPLTSNEVHTISVTGGPSGTFRGILVRAEVATTELVAQAITNVFPPPPLEAITLGLQMDSDDINVIGSSACNNEDNLDFLRLVEGLTHNNNDDKSSMSGEVFMDWPAGPSGLAFPTTVNGRFDITVVVENTSGSSIYYHSGYDVAWTYQEGETGTTDTGIATVNIRPGCEEQGSQLASGCLGSTTVDFQQDCIDCLGQIAQSFAASVPGDSGSIPATAVGEERQDTVCDSLDFVACQTIRGCNAICGQTCSTEVESYGACVLSFERNDVGNPTCGPISCNADVPVTIPSSGGGTETDTDTETNTAPEPEPETTISPSPTVSAQPSSPSLTILVPPGSQFPSDQPSFVPSLQPSTLQSTGEEEEEQEVVTPATDAPTENTGTGGVSIEVNICVNQPCLIANGGLDCCATSPTCRTVGDPSEGVGQCVFTVGGTTSGGAGEREERPGSGTGTGTRQRVRRRMDAVEAQM